MKIATSLPTMSPQFSNPQPVLLDVRDTTLMVTPEHFDRLCRNNPDLRLELTKSGELIIMAPAGGESSRRNLNVATDNVATDNVATDVDLWNRQTNLGEAFDSDPQRQLVELYRT